MASLFVKLPNPIRSHSKLEPHTSIETMAFNFFSCFSSVQSSTSLELKALNLRMSFNRFFSWTIIASSVYGQTYSSKTRIWATMPGTIRKTNKGHGRLSKMNKKEFMTAEDILDTKKITTETFTLLSRMVNVILNKKLNQRNIAKLELRQALIELLGITDYAAQKAISIYYERLEPFEKNEQLTFESLKTKFETSLKNIDEESLISVWKDTTNIVRQYSKEFDDSCALLERVEANDG
ncbi:hypothetical protein BD560DRAFT_468511 [Blakeslea trispora]|nr:hypothetical protein BD560DRAFT_468511 [Blakeslea trispora]